MNADELTNVPTSVLVEQTVALARRERSSRSVMASEMMNPSDVRVFSIRNLRLTVFAARAPGLREPAGLRWRPRIIG